MNVTSTSTATTAPLTVSLSAPAPAPRAVPDAPAMAPAADQAPAQDVTSQDGRDEQEAQDVQAAAATADYVRELRIAQVTGSRSDSVTRPAALTPARVDGLIVYLQGQLALRAERSSDHLDLRG